MSAALVSIIGPPAVGKTTLAEFLCSVLPAELIREDYAGNPFIADAYAGQSAARLPSQLYFLNSRVGQLSLLSWPENGCFVSDYGFCQDRLFATATLTDDDLAAYEKIARRLSGLVHHPDVVIHLDAVESTLMERIARRGRDFERAVTPEFLARMRQSYRAAVAELACPIISIDCEKIDLLAEKPRSQLLNSLRRHLTVESV